MTDVKDGRARNREESRDTAGPAHNAALRGALLAFARPSITPQNSYQASLRPTGAGATAAAFAAHRVTPKPDLKRPSVSTNSSFQSVYNQPSKQVTASYATSLHNSSTASPFPARKPIPARYSLQTPAVVSAPRTKSPASIAASLAVTRSSPQPIEPISRALSSFDGQPREPLPAHGTVNDVRKWLEALDKSPPLVERAGPETSESTSTSPPSRLHRLSTRGPWSIETEPRSYDVEDALSSTSVAHEDSTDQIRSPKPLRNSSAAASLESAALAASTVAQLDVASAIIEYIDEEDDEVENSVESVQDATAPSRTISPTPYAEMQRAMSSSAYSTYSDEEGASEALEPAPRTVMLPYLKPPPLLRTTLRPILRPDVRVRPDTKVAPAPPRKPSTVVALSMAEMPRANVPVLGRLNTQTEQNLEIVKRGTPSIRSSVQLSPARRAESLANAIVASHLAASRVPSPTKPSLPPLTNRQTEQHSHLAVPHRRAAHRKVRTPSPNKVMARTLRKPKSSSDDEDSRRGRDKRTFRIRKHPHKHHEGDRKRWRDEITVRECKRYEGVWAANRGFLLPFTPQELESRSAIDTLNSCVSNLVVRDVWSRSRLPAIVLEEVWDLVDREHMGRLSKEEFVVGMWLIDQRLKGRKLPVKVGESVWRSARGVYGLKVPMFKD